VTPATGTPPFGTAQRIRTRAIWAVALFTASLPPAFIGLGIATATDDQTNIAMPLAFVFWATGLLFALWAAVPALRYWDGLPGQVRWLGSLPLLSVSLFLSVALIGALIG
jgi:zinc transporter ZupT